MAMSFIATCLHRRSPVSTLSKMRFTTKRLPYPPRGDDLEFCRWTMSQMRNKSQMFLLPARTPFLLYPGSYAPLSHLADFRGGMGLRRHAPHFCWPTLGDRRLLTSAPWGGGVGECVSVSSSEHGIWERERWLCQRFRNNRSKTGESPR